MGRSFQSIRKGVISIADRWTRSSKVLKNRDQIFGKRLVEIAKQHSSEGFVGCNDPLEAVIFSVLVELFRNQDQIEMNTGSHVDS